MRRAPRRLAASCRRSAAACRCGPLPTAESHFPGAWKWILSGIAETGTKVATFTVWCSPTLRVAGRKNDQAWIEQKNGAVVRKLLGYHRFEGVAAAQAIGRLYGASRLFVNFFQPSFKLAEKHRQGAQVSKRYHPPETPYERLLQSETLSDAVKGKLNEVGMGLDPLNLLEEMRTMQSQLMLLVNGGGVDVPSMREPDLPAFLAGLSDAWRTGEVRPTHSEETQQRYLRSVREVVSVPAVATQPSTPPLALTPERNARTVTSTVRLMPQLDVEIERCCERQRRDLAKRHIRRRHAFDLI